MNNKPKAILNPLIETAVLRESEDALRDLVTAFMNVGLAPVQVAMMLRAKAEDLDPTELITETTGLH